MTKVTPSDDDTSEPPSPQMSMESTDSTPQSAQPTPVHLADSPIKHSIEEFTSNLEANINDPISLLTSFSHLMTQVLPSRKKRKTSKKPKTPYSPEKPGRPEKAAPAWRFQAHRKRGPSRKQTLDGSDLRVPKSYDSIVDIVGVKGRTKILVAVTWPYNAEATWEPLEKIMLVPRLKQLYDQFLLKKDQMDKLKRKKPHQGRKNGNKSNVEATSTSASASQHQPVVDQTSASAAHSATHSTAQSVALPAVHSQAYSTAPVAIAQAIGLPIPPLQMAPYLQTLTEQAQVCSAMVVPPTHMHVIPQYPQGIPIADAMRSSPVASQVQSFQGWSTSQILPNNPTQSITQPVHHQEPQVGILTAQPQTPSKRKTRSPVVSPEQRPYRKARAASSQPQNGGISSVARPTSYRRSSLDSTLKQKINIELEIPSDIPETHTLCSLPYLLSRYMILQLQVNPIIELVPVRDLEPLVLYDRTKHGKYGDNPNAAVEVMRRALLDNGIGDPIILVYSQRDDRVHVIEGNLRVAAAKTIPGLEYLPARVATSPLETPRRIGKMPPQTLSRKQKLNNFPPSILGFNVANTSKYF